MAILASGVQRARRGGLISRLASLVLASLCYVAVHAATPAAALSDQYRVEAVFLFNFAQFVEWPVTAFNSPTDPLLIGVLGDDPFQSYLDDLVKGEKVGERSIEIRRYQRVEDIADCHILFVCRSEAASVETTIAQLKGRSILTISDLDTFTRAGGMVRFVTENGKIRLRINVEAAKACKLTISSKIIRPATVVTASKD